MVSIARSFILAALINFGLVFQASSQQTPERAAALAPVDRTGADLTARGLIGEWAYGGCTGNGLRRIFRVEPNGSVVSISYVTGGLAAGTKSKVVGYTATQGPEFDLFVEQPNTPPKTGNRIVSTKYRLEGATLKVITSKDDTGMVFVENGRWAIGGNKGQDVGTSERCGGAVQAQPAAGGQSKSASVSDGNVRGVDCSKPGGVAERMICTNGDLTALDRKMTEAYRKHLETLDPAGRSKVTSEQRGFESKRTACEAAGREPMIVSCLAEIIEQRIGELGSAPSAAAAPQPELAIIVAPQHDVTVTVCPGCSGQPTKQPTFSELVFSVPSMAVKGSYFCRVPHNNNDSAIQIAITYDSSSERVFAEDRSLLPMLTALRVSAVKECLAAARTGNLRDRNGNRIDQIPTQVNAISANMMAAFSPSQARSWTVTENVPKARELQKQAQLRAQQQAELERQRVVQSKQAMRAKFLSQYSAQKFVSYEQVEPNPFVFKNTTIAMQMIFRRMLSENEAIFSYRLNSFDDKLLFVTGIPATRFRGNESVVLAVKIFGTKPMKLGAGEVILPYGEYVGDYTCSQNCTEFFD